MLDVLSDLGRRASAALAATVGESESLPAELPIVPAGKPEFGDYQISACLPLAKALGRPPRELAKIVEGALAGDPRLSNVEVAGPGFVNLHLDDRFLAGRAAALLDDPKLGVRDVGAGRRVVIDYSAPNVAKPMHIGHIRSTIIGSALDRTLRALGWDVIADNHLGDWGTQFGKLIVAWRRWLDEDAYRRDAVAELERLYQRFGVEEKRQLEAMGAASQQGSVATQQAPEAAETEDEEPIAGKPVAPILDEARRELVKLQQGDRENRALWQRFVDDSRHAFESIYERLGVRFDHWLGESAYNEMLPIVVEDLQRRGLAVESRRAIIIDFPRLPRGPRAEGGGSTGSAGRGGAGRPPPDDEEKLPPFIVRKGDGGYNYATTDIATMAVRTGVPPWPKMPAGPFGAARVIIVTDERQQLHFKQLFAAARRLGVTAELEHVWFGLMRFWNEQAKEWEAGSTRKGNVIHLADLLDEAERRAYAVAAEKAKERESERPLDEAELREVARVVGLGAVKYNDLSKDRQTLVSFTWEKALALQGNTAPYLQYAYARIRSILRKASPPQAGEGNDVKPAARGEVILGVPVERALAKRLLGYADAVEQVGRTLRPHVLADYLFELATAFSAFYAEVPVLKAEPAARASRLALTELVSRVLAAGLALLGIEVLERM